MLAAGAATRMGEQKQLLPFRGRTLIEHAVGQAIDAGFEPVVVVVGAESQAIKERLAGSKADVIENAEWQSGMGSSVAAGMRWLAQSGTELTGVALLLADQPLVTGDRLKQMRAAFLSGDASIVAARYNGTLGVPALFKRALFPALESLSVDRGARSLLRDSVHTVEPFDLPEAAADIDTPEDYAALPPTAV